MLSSSAYTERCSKDPHISPPPMPNLNIPEASSKSQAHLFTGGLGTVRWANTLDGCGITCPEKRCPRVGFIRASRLLLGVKGCRSPWLFCLEDGNRLRMQGEQFTQVPSYKSGKGKPTMKPKQVPTEELERRSRVGFPSFWLSLRHRNIRDSF